MYKSDRVIALKTEEKNQNNRSRHTRWVLHLKLVIDRVKCYSAYV